MPATSAMETYNTILEIAGNDIAEVSSITGPTETLTAVDATHLTSPNRYREFIGGLRDGGEISLEGNFYPGDTNGQVVLHAALVAATLSAFVLTFSDGTTFTFNGLVTAFEPGAALDDRVTFSATVKVSGLPTIGITTSANMTAWSGTEENGGAALVPVPNPFAAGTYLYNCVVNTASTYIIMTCTHATAATIAIYNGYNGITSYVLTTVASGQLALDAADTITDFTITLTVTGQSPVVYTIRIVRP